MSLTTPSPSPAPAPSGDSSLAELALATPAGAAVLERLGLDYCCGGAQTLGAACEAAGLDTDVVLAELAAAPAEPPPAWASMAPDELVDHLEATHHRYLHEALPRLDALAAKVAGVHGERHPELAEVARLVTEIRADLEPHLAKEEQVLFPMIRELTRSETAPAFHCGSLRNPILVMLREHDRAGELLAALRTTSRSYEVPADGCPSYHALYDGLAELEADTHQHVHVENNVLFPAVLALEASRT